jgi:hypothetical protein
MGRPFHVRFFSLPFGFALAFDRKEEALCDRHRRRGQFFFALLRRRGKRFSVFFRDFDFFCRLIAQRGLCSRSAKVERARSDVVDIAVKTQ